MTHGHNDNRIDKQKNEPQAFCGLLKCGNCGMAITGEYKVKKQKNGNVHRYVYYGCTKSQKADCKCGYTEEKEILKQFEELIKKIEEQIN